MFKAVAVICSAWIANGEAKQACFTHMFDWKFETKKEGKVNMLSRAISVKADKKKTKLIPILTLNYFTKKGKKDDT